MISKANHPKDPLLAGGGLLAASDYTGASFMRRIERAGGMGLLDQVICFDVSWTESSMPVYRHHINAAAQLPPHLSPQEMEAFGQDNLLA